MNYEQKKELKLDIELDLLRLDTLQRLHSARFLDPNDGVWEIKVLLDDIARKLDLKVLDPLIFYNMLSDLEATILKLEVENKLLAKELKRLPELYERVKKEVPKAVKKALKEAEKVKSSGTYRRKELFKLSKSKWNHQIGSRPIDKAELIPDSKFKFKKVKEI